MPLTMAILTFFALRRQELNGVDWNEIALKALIYRASKRKTPQNLSSTGLGILAEKEGFEPSRPVIFDLHP